ncbi:hypothetical protein M426DRAFT_317044 [Hypoxylon sp. CI-4A]|nr:hypothetical protein M426DRAFT_317044 [Hypoxylon sp. CI-4A]
MSSTEIEIATSTADLPSGEPIPSSAPAPVSKPKPMPIKAVLAAAPSNIDAFLAHVQRCLQTPSGIDTILLFLCYASRLSASVLEATTRPAIRRSANRLLALAASLPPSATLVFSAKAAALLLPSRGVALVLGLVRRLRALSALLGETRTFLRLWGLLNMYFWLRRLVLQRRQDKLEKEQQQQQQQQQQQEEEEEEEETEKQSGGGGGVQKEDRLETGISWLQLSLCVVFQALENGAYLSSKGVLGWASATQRRAGLWSARFWAAFVGVEVGRLFYESRRRRGLRSGEDRFADAKTAAEVQREDVEWADAWKKSVLRNLAWAPLTVHWSLEQGLVPEMAVGALGSIPGVIQIRDLWRRTAEEE